MRKFLKLIKVITLTSTISLLPIACSVNEEKRNSIDISNINIDTTNVNVTLNQSSYDNALTKFKTIIQIKISNLVKDEEKPQYGRDYKIVVIDHNLFSKINKLELITINVQSAITTHVLKGSFNAQVNLVNDPKSISDLKIDKQKFDHTVIDKTTFQDAIENLIPIIQTKINTVDASAVLNRDYVINVEGHKLSSLITKQDYGNNYVDVNAITDDSHYLLIGAFSFILAIS